MTAPQQQPVAARYFNQFNGWVVTHIEHARQMHQANGYPMQLLYTEPVQAQPACGGGCQGCCQEKDPCNER